MWIGRDQPCAVSPGHKLCSAVSVFMTAWRGLSQSRELACRFAQIKSSDSSDSASNQSVEYLASCLHFISIARNYHQTNSFRLQFVVNEAPPTPTVRSDFNFIFKSMEAK